MFKIFNIEENRFEEKFNLRVGKNINLNYSASDVVWNQVDGKNIIFTLPTFMFVTM